MRFADLFRDQTSRHQRAHCFPQIGRKGNAVSQLQEVHDEFQIDQPAPCQLGVKLALGLFVRCHFCAHFQHIFSQLRGIARRRHARGISTPARPVYVPW